MSAHFDAKRFSEDSLERRRVPSRGPELELGVARRPNLQQPIVAAIAQVDGRDGLRVAAIETFSEPQDRGQRAHGGALLARQLAEALVAPLRRRAAVIPREQRDGVDLVGLEASQIAVLD